MRRSFFFILIISFICFSCKNDVNSGENTSQLTVENMAEMLPKIKDQFKNWSGTPSDLATQSEKTVAFLLKNQKIGDAVSILTTNLKGHFNKEVVVSNGGTLANIYETFFNNKSQANLIRQSIGANFPDSGVEYDNTISMEEQISAIGKNIFDSKTGFNRQKAQDFVVAVENFATLNPKNDLAPKFLIDAATISGNLGSGGKTLELFRTVYERFPNHKKAGDAKFYEAFTYDSNLKDFKKAEIAYKAFMDEFPEHEFVAQAKVMLENLGKSDEELLKSLGN